ncbi:hypothetical protein HMPREF1985_02038 [Mitsuokella sp. oral taxon 131 str. W9106]|nr:hypothetical protein HMPREF1985_02038 [Mitsuokella sp. oral taxon 131 str. W9106]
MSTLFYRNQFQGILNSVISFLHALHNSSKFYHFFYEIRSSESYFLKKISRHANAHLQKTIRMPAFPSQIPIRL